MRKLICLLLSITLISSFVIIPQQVHAAETITDEALFMTYPTYLSNSEMDEGLAKAEAAYYAVINSYSKSDETVAALMTSMSEGISILIKEGLANLGYGETLYETQVREAATKYMQSMLTNENVIKKASGIVDKAYKTLKTSYSIASNVDKTTMMADLVKVATENDISIRPDDIDDLVNDLYDAGTLKTDLAAIGEANKLWKIVFEFTEIHAIEKTTLDLLMDELSKSGQTGSDLYLGLSLLKADMEKDSASYVLKYYLNDKTVSYLADKVDDLIGAATSANAVSLVTMCMKVFADYIYVNAKAEDITQAIMQTSFVSSIDICLSQYRLKFLQGTGTTEDMKTYESLYGAYLVAHKATLDSCYDIAKITDKFSLGGDCMIWSSNIETLYTYDKYIEWCKKEISHDISNSELDKTTGSSTIADALNEETIASRLERVFRLYPAGDKWAGEFGGTRSSLGYAGKVFNHIFDKTMGSKVENDYQYILTSNKNVRLIGRLEEKGVTEAALKELFANVRIGDVVITSGQYDYLHAMTVVGMGETGPIVYDVDSKYGPSEEYTHLIQKYEFPYSKMADAFSSNGKYLTKPGISVYRAIKKVNTTNSGTSLYYEEYDDSVNYVIEDGVLTGYKGSRTTIEIPDGVTEIAASCFKNNTSIKCVYMPDTITTIGNSAFYGCTNLRYIYLSNSLTAINSDTFGKCSALTSIVIPNSVTEIGGSAFASCSKLTNVSFSENLIKIAGYAFNSCTLLDNVELPDSLMILERRVFYNCTNLENVKLSKGLEEMASCCFMDCTSLASIEIPASLKECTFWYGDNGGPFYRCTALNNVTFEEGTTLIPGNLFNGCTGLKEITLPDSIVEIGGSAFGSCTNLTDIKLNEYLVNIRASAFAGCTSLESIVIPDSVVELPQRAFNGCTALKNVKLPSYLTKMDSCCFMSCTALESIHIPASLNEMSYWYGDKGGPFYKCFALNNVTFEKGATKIIRSLFDGCTGLKEIIIPDSITEIDINAFAACTNLEKVTMGNSVQIIGAGTFSGCSKLTDFELPSSLQTIGDSVFYNCVALTKMNIPDGVTELGGAVFGNCTGLKEVTMTDSVLEMGDIFDGCTALEKVELSNNIEVLWDETFRNCKKLKVIELPSKLGDIGSYCFYNCDALESLTFPDSVYYMRDYICYDCNNLKEVKFGQNMWKISASAFRKCPKLTTITLPRFCSTINQKAFSENTGLTTVYIPKNVTSIATDTFSYPGKMTIHGAAGSYAETYANENNIKFVAEDIPLTRIDVLETEINVTHATNFVIPVVFEPSDYDTSTITVTSSNDNLVSVSNNSLACYATGSSWRKGSATITITADDVVKTVTVNVTEPVDVSGVFLNKTSTELKVGETDTLIATVTPSDATNKTVTWSSSNPSVATVKDGLIEAKSGGTTTIMVKTSDGDKTATCEVTVVAPTIKVNNIIGQPGSNVDVTIDIANNTGVALVNFDMDYNSDVMTLKAATLGNIFTGELDCNLEKVPFTFNVYSGGGNKTENGTLLTLQFEIKSDCTEGDYNITLSNVEMIDIDENILGFSTVNGKITVRDSIPGDVTGDGKVTRADLLRLAKSFSGFEVEMDMTAADVTADGKVTRADLLRLAKHFSGFDVELGK